MLEHRKIWVVDDDEVSCFISETILKIVSKDIETRAFTSPELALETLFATKDNPDVVFIDLNMPVMNGFELLEKIEPFKSDFENTKFYVLTSSLDPRDKARADKISIVEKFIMKPLGESDAGSLLKP